MKQLMDVNEFADALGVTRSCIRRWILERRISVIKLGRLVRIPVSEADRLMTEGLRTGPTRQQFNTLPTEPRKTVREAKP